MFLCEVVANQLQQSKGCCGVSHVLGSVHHWLVTYWDSCIERRDCRYIRFSFWNPSLLLQKKEFLLRFLYAFGFCNQAKSLTPSLKILLVFLCEAVANQLQQSMGCCGVSHVLRSVHHWLVTYCDSCIERRDCRYNTSLIGYWGKGSTVGWYEILGFLLFVTACLI